MNCRWAWILALTGCVSASPSAAQDAGVGDAARDAATDAGPEVDAGRFGDCEELKATHTIYGDWSTAGSELRRHCTEQPCGDDSDAIAYLRVVHSAEELDEAWSEYLLFPKVWKQPTVVWETQRVALYSTRVTCPICMPVSSTASARSCGDTIRLSLDYYEAGCDSFGRLGMVSVLPREETSVVADQYVIDQSCPPPEPK